MEMKKKVCFVVAVPITAQAFLRDHIVALGKDYDVYLMGNGCNDEVVKTLDIKGSFNVDIERGISIWKDCKAVYQAWRIFMKMKFNAVHSVTPKAGLVTALASFFAGIKHRTHIFTGQVWATRKGLSRFLLKGIDKIIVGLNNHILVDGKSQRAFLEREGVLRPGKAIVFGNGSISGVNTKRFWPDYEARKNIRKEIGIKDGTLCFVFLGRLNHDKGIGELYEAFNKLAGEVKNVFLLLVGYDEEGYIEKVKEYNNIEEGRNFFYYGKTSMPEKVLNAGDVFVLPTYREGFGTSVLEAACAGLPCISSDAYGVMDAYVDGETGLKCKVGDSESLYYCMKQMYENQDMVRLMGEKSRQRVLLDFKSEFLTTYWVDFYHSIIPV